MLNLQRGLRLLILFDPLSTFLQVPQSALDFGLEALRKHSVQFISSHQPLASQPIKLESLDISMFKELCMRL